MSDEGATTSPRRSLPLWGFAVVVIGYLAIIQLGGRLAIRVFDVEGDDLLTTRDVLVTMWIPLGTALRLHVRGRGRTRLVASGPER